MLGRNALVTRIALWILSGVAAAVVPALTFAEYDSTANVLTIDVEELSVWITGATALASASVPGGIAAIWRLIVKREGGVT